MIDKELLERLDQWHEDNQHKKIIEEIEAQPEEIRLDYELQGRLARAMNNVGKYDEAIRILERVREAGERDDRWWSRMGFALYHQDKYDAARECFRKALEVNPGNEDARSFLVWLGLKVNGGGSSNGWKEKPEGKPRPQSQGNANGWERQTGETGPRRPKESDTVRNGWAERKAPAQGKPRSGSGNNDWEGRGWEGTAELATAVFGTLRFPVKEGLFEMAQLFLDGKTRLVELTIREDLAVPETWEPLTALLDRVPELCKKARERLDGEADSLFAPTELRGVTVAREEGGIRCGLIYTRGSGEEEITVRFDQEGKLIG